MVWEMVKTVTLLSLLWNPELRADPPSPPSRIWSGHGKLFRWVVGLELVRLREIQPKLRVSARGECFAVQIQGRFSEEHRVSAALSPLTWP